MTEERTRGRLIRGVGGLYTVRDEAGAEYTLRARGKFRREGLSPLVGDRVLFTPGKGEAHGWLEEILPRSSRLVRPPAANVSLLVIVLAAEPAPDWLLADRLLVYAGQSGFDALLCVNKHDLDPALLPRVRRQYAPSGFSVLGVSALTGEGIAPLRERMRGEICCMAGQSAVGKSTLLNALCGLRLKTGELSKIRRGRHTTRHAELLEADGLTVLDTPGFSLLKLDAALAPECLQNFYPEFLGRGGCRFLPCLHDREPGCAVRAAVAAGDIDEDRYERYRVLLSEVREAWKGRYRSNGG
ncbi:MAG: ribosome small subunit-dependent GTPase A [Firmicutes bacterium]|nr:ribosome small subunit-dependent GTPase A [Bacillota bacterium]